MCYIYSPSTIGINKGSYHNYYKPFTILRHCLGCYLDQLGSLFFFGPDIIFYVCNLLMSRQTICIPEYFSTKPTRVGQIIDV